MYTIDDFKRLGLYEERSSEEEYVFSEGRVATSLSSRIQYSLNNPGGNTHNSNRSSQDSSVITSMLRAGINPNDTFKTFANSPRGADARERKNSHFEDYLQRTIRKCIAFIESSPVSSSVKVNFSNQKLNPSATGMVISMGNEIEVEKVNWIWPGYIPAGKLTLIAGDPSMGKSTIVSDILSRISRGKVMPSGVRGVTGNSLVASAEDAPEDTIIPRIVASGGDLNRIGVIREVRDESEVTSDESRYLSFPRDLNLLRKTLKNRACRVLVIDPINAFLDRQTDTNNDKDIRAILHPLEKIAQETGTSILIVAHLNKKEDSSMLYRIGGSIGWVGAARSVLAVSYHDEQRILFPLKCNLVKRPPAISYEIKDVKKTKSTSNTWLGEEVINSSAIRWLGEVEFDPFAKKVDGTTRATQDEEAKTFLRSLLTNGAVQVDLIYEQAKGAGISRIVVNRIRAQAQVEVIRRSGNWFWQLQSQN